VYTAIDIIGISLRYHFTSRSHRSHIMSCYNPFDRIIGLRNAPRYTHISSCTHMRSYVFKHICPYVYAHSYSLRPSTCTPHQYVQMHIRINEHTTYTAVPHTSVRRMHSSIYMHAYMVHIIVCAMCASVHHRRILCVCTTWSRNTCSKAYTLQDFF